MQSESPVTTSLAESNAAADAAGRLNLTSESIPAGAANAGLQEVLSGVAESIAAPIVFLTPDGQIEVINQRLLDFFGKTREQMEGWKSSEIIHPDDRELTIDALKHAMESGQPYEVEARRRRVDGEYRWWRSNGYPMRDAQGQILRWCVLYTDIDDRRKAEEALRQQEFLLSALQESIAAPMSFWRPDGQLERVNQLALDYFGRRIDTIDDWKAIVHPDDDPPGYAKWLSAVSTGIPYYEELRLLRADGVYRWHDVRNFPMRDSKGKIVRWCVIQIDIEDRKKTEEALAASERRLERIINTMPAMAWSANPDGTCDFFNQHHLEYVGLPLEAMQGIGFVQTFHPDDKPSMMAQWQVMLDSGRGGEVEGRIRRFDGEYRWFLFRTNPLLDASGKVTKWFGINVDIEDRKRALEQLRESEINLRQQTETIPQMLWGANAEGSVAYCNSQMLSFTGRKAGEIYGSGWLNNVHPNDREQSVAVWLAAVSSGKLYQTEVRVRRFDGEYRWCSVSALPLRDGTGAIIKWHGACIDIHDRKVAEDALRASERRLAQIIDAIPAYVWSARPDGGADYFNRHYLDYLGVTTGEVQGWNWASVVHPDDLDQHVAIWKRSLEEGSLFESQTRLKGADGSYRWFLNRGSSLKDAEGEVKWFGVTIDIEGMKRAEERLRVSELNLRQLTETIPQKLWGATREGAVDYLNGHLKEWFGGADGVMKDEWINLVHPEDRERTIHAWTNTVASGADYQQDVRFLHWAGKYRWCVVKGRPLRDEAGNIIKWHGVVEDMQDWKQSQDELRETQSELAHVTRVMTMGQLTASIAHELNQPLSGIMTNAGTALLMLNVDPPDIEGARDTAKRTMRDAQRASDVVTRLRALFSRRPTASEAVDVNTAVREVIALLSRELQRSEVTLRSQLSHGLPQIMGDRVQLQQVIVNFIVNAADAMREISDRPRELTISTGIDDAGLVRVAVTDVGVGFDPADAQRIFSPFYTTKPHGMGVGLSVSRTIIENHKGRLWAEANKGPGSTFSFSVPTAAGESASE